MALTAAQKLTCYRILGLTYGPGAGANSAAATIHTGFGVDLTLDQMDALRTQVNTYIDNLSADVEAKVAELVTLWDSLPQFDLEMTNGAVGGISGITFSTKQWKGQIREYLQEYVPVMHEVEAIKRFDGPKPNYVRFAR
jgi:hypothetical protein